MQAPAEQHSVRYVLQHGMPSTRFAEVLDAPDGTRSLSARRGSQFVLNGVSSASSGYGKCINTLANRHPRQPALLARRAIVAPVHRRGVHRASDPPKQFRSHVGPCLGGIALMAASARISALVTSQPWQGRRGSSRGNKLHRSECSSGPRPIVPVAGELPFYATPC